MPFGRLVNDSDRVAGLTVRVSGPVTTCAGFELSVTCTVRFEVPGVVGVPLIVHPFSVNPAGSVPVGIAQVYGVAPPVAVIVAV